MGVADRVARRRTERTSEQLTAESQKDSTGRSSLPVPVEAPHIRRLKGVMSTLHTFIQEQGKDTGAARMAFFMNTVTDEIIEEMKDYDALTIRAFMFQIGEAISWIGHGDNERVPDAIRIFVEQIQPSEAREEKDGTDTPIPAIAQAR